MKIVENLPRPVRAIENCWIPLSDGCRLAARIWLPEDAEADPVPAVLEYIPYRKRDFTRGRDQAMHPYFAGHGYAAVRVDLRGSGESDGLLLDEYLKQEQDDALEVIAWLAVQPWCSGAVGMMGKSWGGFNSLQVAARRPPALKAILSVMGTDDRYKEDIHYRGGCLLNDNFWWGSVMHAFNARPPDPEIVGAGWREAWRARLEAMTFLPETWLQHQTRDAYWQHGSVSEDYAAIGCPVFLVGGWADAYRDTPLRLAANLEVPWKALIGPWAHLYPHEGLPEPKVGFLQEAIRWWDHWLKGEDRGMMAEPPLRVWMQASVAPAPEYAERPGRWVAEASWPSPRITSVGYAMNPGSLDRKAGAEAVLSVASPQSLGLAGGDWGSFALAGDLPLDQRLDDGGALVFDSPPLEAPMEILGNAEIRLVFASDRPAALVAARLSDMAPDGQATAVARGLFNLTHRRGHDTVVPLVPGARDAAVVPLHATAYAVPAGHRLRLSLSTSYWPIVWPSPEPVSLTVFAGASRLLLPVRPPRAEDAALRPLPAPETATPLKVTNKRPGRLEHTVTRDLATGEVVRRTFIDGGVFGPAGLLEIDEIGLTLGHLLTRTFTISDADPLSARAEMEQSYVMARGDWQIEITIRSAMTSTKEDFLLSAELTAREGEATFFERTWRGCVPRNGL